MRHGQKNIRKLCRRSCGNVDSDDRAVYGVGQWGAPFLGLRVRMLPGARVFVLRVCVFFCVRTSDMKKEGKEMKRT